MAKLLAPAWRSNPFRSGRIPLRWQRTLTRIGQFAETCSTSTDDELRRLSLSLRYRVFSGEPLARILPEAFALVQEAAYRAIGMRHYDVQLLGGIALFDRAVAQMQTGEGKTLTATLPLYLAALPGLGAHLATANDYLARRDAEFVLPIFELLGMDVGIVHSGSSRHERQLAYECDVTYGASREFGFDFLRDRLRANLAEDRHDDLLGRMLGIPDEVANNTLLQRTLNFMLVDEADSILIDEARTPLVVSSLPGSSQELAAAVYRWSARHANQFDRQHDFTSDDRTAKTQLTAKGRRKVRDLQRPAALSAIPLFDLYENIELAIRVARDFARDQHYVLRQGEVVIVDENTGRLAEGRKWRDGIHQAIEAREGVEITVKTGEAARVTAQHLFLLYDQLAGMTGTALTSRQELRRIYGLRTREIPTHRPVLRQKLPDRVFGTGTAKWNAVTAEIRDIHQSGRPILVGTRSIETSELLSGLLTAANVRHQVLNAHRHAEEAAIVAAAGNAGRVTVATNMAGRGTDIKLSPEAAEAGGLYVIGTAYHDSRRIDQQLFGRCARQGDPGTVRQFGSLDDAILAAGFGLHVAERYRQIGAKTSGELPRYARLLQQAQARVDAKHFRQRRLLLFHEQERRKAQLEMGQDPYLDVTM